MKRFLSLVAMLALVLTAVRGQEPSAKTPFAYPVAPDTCSTLESRCNYIVSNFWGNYNITRPIADDAAFDVAFRDWVNFFRYAHRNIVMASIRDFMFKAQSNTPNLLKVGSEAEAALFSDGAEYWSDEVYLAFAQFMANAKHLKNDVREHYRDQILLINGCQEGMVLNLEYTGTDGQRHKLTDLGAESYIVFVSDSGVDSSIDRVRLSTDMAVNALITGGHLAVVNIEPVKYSSQWAAAAAARTEGWVMGCNDKLMQQMDVRKLPTCYFLDKDGKIVSKNLSVEAIKNALN